MRILILCLAVLMLAVPARSGRESEAYDYPVVSGELLGDHELAYDDGGFERWGINPSWAEEIQVGFAMPNTDPWMLTTVRLWVGGTLDHSVVVREAPNGITGAPGEVIDESVLFNPGTPIPPVRWVDVDISGLSLVLCGGEEIFIGVRLDGIDDSIGLDDTAADGHTWGFYRGEWCDDTGDWGVNAGVRVIPVEASFSPDSTTWGAIKALFL
ncbi:MAG: hypothetical protein KAY24_18985 [Candidatus Eisenbacteria sp.]|nr:hypothetical protein [Candidatus Eisenbacteria bacterium]